jgi:hypothetical protein
MRGLAQCRKLEIASLISLLNGSIALGWVIFLTAYSARQDTLLVRFVLPQRVYRKNRGAPSEGETLGAVKPRRYAESCHQPGL